MRMYLGFLYQQNRKYYDIHFLLNGKEAKANGAELATPTEFGLRSALKGFMSKYNTARSNMYDVKDDFKFFKEIILELGQKGETVYAQATEIRRLNKLGEKVEPAIVHNFIDGLLEMTEHAAYACDTTINYLFSKADLFSKVFTVSQENKTLAQEQKIATRGDEFIYYRLNLVEKTESFLGIASTCNDAWMDIVDKKYALGVLKLIEVSGQVAQPYNESSIFIEVQDLVDEIAKLAGMEGSTNWYSLVKFLNAAYKKPKVKVSDDIKVAAAEILRNYNQIIVFGEAENLISGIKSNLDLLRTQLVDISLGPDWTLPSDVDRAKIKNLLESTDFKNLIISYYSGIGIASLKEKIQTEMPKIKIGDKPLFTSDEATNFAKIVEKYYKAAFDFYVLTKQKDRKYKKSDMKKVHDELITWLRDYTLLLPEKLDWRINPIVIKVLHLVNDLAVAEDGEDIEEIIERFALPPGSSSIKRESIFDVSLNAYPGLIGGGELTWRNKSSYVVGTASFTAPVGLALSWGTEKGYSHGIFLPIIDIGAITRFRFDDDTTSTLLTDLRFQDVFSPGLYYSLGFRKSPISLNIGAQYGPELRMIEPDGTGNFFPSMRFGLGLTVDIPLLKLYTKPRL
jgi:hypothetical protein